MTSTISEMALFVSRWVELSILGKATIVLALGLTAAWVAGRGRASVRHLFLVVTFGMLLVLPVIILTTPGVTIDVPVARASDSTVAASALPTSGPLAPHTNASRPQPENSQWSLPSWPQIVRLGWVGGTVILFLSLAAALWRLRRIRRDGLPWPELRELTQPLAAECGIQRSIEVLLHEDIPAPLTCGVWRPAIILPTGARNWSEVHLRRALIHELEHVRRRDWLVQLVARATCACYWFHPLVWVAWRRLGLEAERACDDAVVQNSERADYAEQLVLLAQQMSNAHARPALGMANRSDLSTRVSAILDGSQRRGRVGLLAAAVAMSVATILMLAIAPVRAVSRVDNASQQSQSNATPASRRVSATDRALFEAAASGDVSGIEQLLNAGANVNCAIDGDGSPLIGAARNGYIAAVRLLLDRGADPNLSVRGDGNPLIMAAREGHADVVTLLLDRGASIDQMVPDDENALIQASGSGQLAVVNLLVKRGADVNARVWVEGAGESKGEWRTPLGMARRRGHNAVVDFLLSAGAREN
jgi:ankyrin repeat protein/beta-lactamase regulating signal transducer with metallopeptidase domain